MRVELCIAHTLHCYNILPTQDGDDIELSYSGPRIGEEVAQWPWICQYQDNQLSPLEVAHNTQNNAQVHNDLTLLCFRMIFVSIARLSCLDTPWPMTIGVLRMKCILL